MDIEFDKLADLPKFEGHNGTSLCRLYQSMLGNVILRCGQKSKREVTVDQVEQHWKASKRISKTRRLVEKEQDIVKVYLEATKCS